VSDSEPPGSGPDIPLERPLSSFGVLGWAAFTTLLALVVLQVSLILRPGLAFELVNQQLCFGLAFVLSIFLVARAHLGTRPVRDALGARVVGPWVYVGAAFSGLLLHLPATWLNALVEGRWPVSDEELQSYAEHTTFTSIWHKAVFGAVAIAIGPFFEEIYCRGVLFRALRRSAGPAQTVVVTALGFAMLHLNPRNMVNALLGGLWLGVIRLTAGSVGPSLLAHMLYNGLIIVAFLGGWDDPSSRQAPVPLVWGLGGTALALAALAATVALSLRDPAATAGRADDAS
jgi:membrane protease YdiL (CAAX protease family)